MSLDVDIKQLELSWQIPNAEYNRFFPKKNRYCLVIPLINEGEKFKKQLTHIKKLNILDSVDLIIADGGSSDGSVDPDFLKTAGVTALLIKRDKGKLGAQLRMGYAYAIKEGYEGIITMDGNNKDSVESIAGFIKALDEGYDYIQGSRFIKGGKAINTPLVRFLAIRLIHAPVISAIAGFPFTDTTNGFRAYSLRFLLHPRVQPFRDLFQTYELLFYLSVRASQLGLKVKEIPVTRRYPDKGPVPTKIHGLSGALSIIFMLIKLSLSLYNPPKQNVEVKFIEPDKE